jgi:hypothetical protein
VFGIALGRVWREVEGDLAVLPGIWTSDGSIDVDQASDELARRRLRRTS